ncbi:hypothetical protein LCGC14_1815210 [marine sediment metagenome]|uniref:Nucleotide-diphospho-sugar transferase domain-containing protein n=1 Tax=marine sediment metagenome TaxID=412755 RepID=A0A0F9GKP2_9ZZZZ
MKNLIYQYWDGSIKESCRAGIANLKEYAERIGAEHIFEDNPRFVNNLGSYSPHYGAFKPIYDNAYTDYNNILFCDTDIFALDGLTDNIFDYFTASNAEIGICTEPLQPELRQKTDSKIINHSTDEKWANLIKQHYGVDVPRDEQNRMKVYNSGVVIYSRKGLDKAKENFPKFKDYANLINKNGLPAFYTCDQPFLHAMIFVHKFDILEMDNEWNRYITWANKNPKTICDPRTKDTKFVHIMFRSADNLSAEQHNKIANLPIEEWGVDKDGDKFIRGDCLTGAPLK